MARLVETVELTRHCVERYRSRVDSSADEADIRALLATGQMTSRPPWLLKHSRDDTECYITCGQVTFPVARGRTSGGGWTIPSTLVSGLDHLVGAPGRDVIRFSSRITDEAACEWLHLSGRLHTADLISGKNSLRDCAVIGTVFRTRDGEIALPLRGAAALRLGLSNGRVIGVGVITGAAALPDDAAQVG
jgi:hypothetical protein